MRNATTAALALTLVAVPLSVAQAASDGTPPIAARTAIARIATPTPQGGSKVHVQVRVYNAGVVPAADQLVALRAAASILAGADIGTKWLACGDAASTASQMTCDTPLLPGELSVRFVQLPGVASVRGELELGYSLVDTAIGAGTLATIYVDRVRWLASDAGTDPAILTGFAVAHEIGHLLLGTNAHGASGLMRAIWSRDELRRGAVGDWVFARSDAARMRSSIVRREGLRSPQSRFHATGCSDSFDDAARPAAGAAGAAGAADCGGAGLAAVRGLAPRSDR